MKVNANGLASLVRENCPFQTEFIRPGKVLGRVCGRFRTIGQEWNHFDTYNECVADDLQDIF